MVEMRLANGQILRPEITWVATRAHGQLHSMTLAQTQTRIVSLNSSIPFRQQICGPRIHKVIHSHLPILLYRLSCHPVGHITISATLFRRHPQIKTTSKDLARSQLL